MEWFSFNNIRSDSIDVIVKQMPSVPRAERNIESITVNGRNGNLHIDNKNYFARSYTIGCVLKNKAHIDDVCAYFVGVGNLILSKYPDRFFKATIKNQIDFSKYLTYLDEFPLQLELDPIAYSINETTETLSASGNITVSGNTDVYPILTVTGTGTVTVNGYSVEVSETGITVDCDLQQCYKSGVAKNDKVTLDEFPHIKPGTNAIVFGSGITGLTIKYRAGWL
jgi:phage-related protein